MNLRGVSITTKRLRLIPISPAYREDIFREFTERVARYTYPQPTGDIADTDDFITASIENMEQGMELQFVAVLKRSGEFIGCTGLHDLWGRPEPGLWLKESAWGKGFGFEIVAALKRWADQNLEHEFLYYPVNERNVASRRISEKLGGRLDPDTFIVENVRGKRQRMVAYRIY